MYRLGMRYSKDSDQHSYQESMQAWLAYKAAKTKNQRVGSELYSTRKEAVTSTCMVHYWTRMDMLAFPLRLLR